MTDSISAYPWFTDNVKEPSGKQYAFGDEGQRIGPNERKRQKWETI
jgi:hypothetical protein